MEIKLVKVYKFDELTPEVQEKVKERYREGEITSDWWDLVFEGFMYDCPEKGVTIDVKEHKYQRKDGTTRTPRLYFQSYPWDAGFYGSFDLSFAEAAFHLSDDEKLAVKVFRDEMDDELSIRPRSRSGMGAVVLREDHPEPIHSEAWGRVIDAVQKHVDDLVSDLVVRLKQEEEYRTSDEYIRESIEENGDLFFFNGAYANTYIDD